MGTTLLLYIEDVISSRHSGPLATTIIFLPVPQFLLSLRCRGGAVDLYTLVDYTVISCSPHYEMSIKSLSVTKRIIFDEG